MKKRTKLTIAGVCCCVLLLAAATTMIDLSTQVVNQLPVANGGTGASTAAAARTNLNVPGESGSGLSTTTLMTGWDGSGNVTTCCLVSGAASNTGAGTIGMSSSGAGIVGLGDGTNTRTLREVLFKGVAFATQTNPVAAGTSILSTPGFSSGSLTLVANQQTVGSVVHVRAAGNIVVGASGQLNFQPTLNGTSLGTLTTESTNPATTSIVWTFDFWIYCSAVGNSGTATMKTYGIGQINNTTTLVYVVNMAGVSSTATGVATTGTQLIDLQAYFSVSNASNSITTKYAEAEIY